MPFQFARNTYKYLLKALCSLQFGVFALDVWLLDTHSPFCWSEPSFSFLSCTGQWGGTQFLFLGPGILSTEPQDGKHSRRTFSPRTHR